VFSGNHFSGGSSSTMIMINSTVTGNTTPDGQVVGGNGAGVSALGSVLYMSNSTVVDNHAFRGPETTGGAFSIGSGEGGGVLGRSMRLKNSILANNIGGNCAKITGANSNKSQGYNISDDGTCLDVFTQTGDLNYTPAGLDPAGLQSNGGLTQTIALLSNSPAVDAIPLSSCTEAVHQSPVTTDQRGVPRPQNKNCDIGAYEHFHSRFVVLAVEVYLIVDQVQALPLDPGSRQGLTAPLQGAVDSINRGALSTAVNQLGAFINQTNGLVRAGVLTTQLATPLTAAAQTEIQKLGSVTP
jgi:hypothetical protein